MWLVFLKEIKELLRDRKTLFFMIALPILVFPLIFGAISYFTGKAFDEEKNRVLIYAVSQEHHSPELMSRLSQLDKFEKVPLQPNQDFSELIRQGQVDFILELPSEIGADVLQTGQSVVNIYLNDASSVSMVYSRVNEVVSELSVGLQARVFDGLNLDKNQREAVLQPLLLEKVDVADKRENWGEKIGGMIPYLIFILCFQGAMFPATDLAAGEKERGTLETLLISPIARHQLVMGKFLTIGFAGVTSAMITVVSMAVWGLILSQGMAIDIVAEFMAGISLVDFLLMFLMLIPVVAIFASVLLSLSIYARSYKEAQSYMGSLVFLVVVPVMLAMLPGVTLDGGWAWVPLTNVALAIKELIKGTMDYFALLPILGSTLVIAGGLLAFCLHWFNREKVLFR